MTTRHAPLRVVVLAYQDMNLLDLTGPVQTLSTASRRHGAPGQALYDVIVASEAGGLVATSSGLQVMTVALAALTGHADEQNLRRTFVRRMNVTPGEYRDRFSAHEELVS